jgi:2-(1,2-epoxy-1,2-dihydrophenyl)acetyl-CoA isomerase
MGESAYLVDGHLAVDMCPSSSAWWLPRLVSYQRAMELFLTARRIPAAEAVSVGLATRVVPDAEIDEDAARLAASVVARASRSTLVATKRAVRFGLESTFARSVEQVAYLRALS